MSCPHRFTEMVTAAHADGMCPLCMAARIDRLEAENRKLRSLTEAALTGLYNGFEPDNQSALYKRIKTALDGKEG